MDMYLKRSSDILFNDFLIKQEKVIKKITLTGDNTKNFGLKYFM